MKRSLQPVRGTHDLLPEAYAQHQHVASIAANVAQLYGFQPMAVPIFEFSEVFHRTLGESSDVVSKETYTFEDRGGESMTLRPELTAGIARAFVSNGLQEKVPFKAFYHGPAFRYERPQKGRQRQFHQIGVELIGAGEVQADIEVIALASQLLETLGVSEHVTLELNTLGDPESRAAHREALVAYFAQHEAELSEDSQRRLKENPLRILDSKNEGDKALAANAPKLRDYLNETSQNFWNELRAGLDALGITYTENDQLVRGLDYYHHTVFEFTTDQLGAQNTVLAGGRYDGLVEMMGGQPNPGIGWAAGVERLCLLLETLDKLPKQEGRSVAVIPMSSEQQGEALQLLQTLRGAGITAEMGYRGNAGKRMKKANNSGAAFAAMIGEDEAASGTVTIKNFAEGTQESIANAEVTAYLKQQLT